MLVSSASGHHKQALVTTRSCIIMTNKSWTLLSSREVITFLFSLASLNADALPGARHICGPTLKPLIKKRLFWSHEIYTPCLFWVRWIPTYPSVLCSSDTPPRSAVDKACE